jgi:IS30 family transposase
VAKKVKPSRQHIWTADDIRRLRALAKQKLPAAVIAKKLKRSLDSTKKKASRLGTPLGLDARWSTDDRRKLKTLARKKRPVASIAKTLKRTIAATEKMASKLGISLDMRT